MKDIATAAGVSQSTVSRVLNDRDSPFPFSPQTRERVLTAAERLRYRPNPLARGLRGAATMLLGVIVRDITDYFFAGAIEAVASEAAERGYQVVLGHAHGRAEEAIALRAVLETRHCDAIILFGDMRHQPRLIEDLREVSIPVVALWQGRGLPGIATVNVDNRLGIRAGLDHLTSLGHTRIAFTGGNTGDTRERRAAFSEYAEALRLERPSEFSRQVANDLAAGAAALRALMQLQTVPTAVMAATDTIAIGVLHAAYELGLRVPDDLSVMGFDDISLSAFTVPSLTSIRMPVPEMVSIGVRLAIEAVATGGRRRASKLVIPPTLTIRESTGRAPQALDGHRGG